MSLEQVFAVAAPLDDNRKLLVADIRSAAARAEKAMAGDRADVARYEMLCGQLEHWAMSRRDADGVLSVKLPVTMSPPVLLTAEDHGDLAFLPVHWQEKVRAVLDADGVLTTIRLPLQTGEAAVKAAAPVTPPPPAEVWKSKTGARGTRAVRERFEEQIRVCLNGAAGAMSPSDIQNAVLTSVLRDYVALAGQRVDVAVEYRDGSRSRHPFPLRSVKMVDRLKHERNELRLALLSIRHTEMDAVVDGAFLRNAEISQPRAAADTDDLVFDISRQQLLALTDDGRSRLHLRIYQTGLDTAIVGFYRAVTMHLIEHPASLAVTPMFFQDAQKTRGPRRGRPGNKGRPQARNTRPPTNAKFREGPVWATR